jgi:hypothetical protein
MRFINSLLYRSLRYTVLILDNRQYIVNFPVQNVETKCPVNNCPAHLKT